MIEYEPVVDAGPGAGEGGSGGLANTGGQGLGGQAGTDAPGGSGGTLNPGGSGGTLNPGGSGGTSGSGGTGGSSNPTCEATATDECTVCAYSSCCSELTACAKDTIGPGETRTCYEIWECASQCPGDFVDCLTACDAGDFNVEVNDLFQCIYVEACELPCQ